MGGGVRVDAILRGSYRIAQPNNEDRCDLLVKKSFSTIWF